MVKRKWDPRLRSFLGTYYRFEKGKKIIVLSFTLYEILKCLYEQRKKDPLGKVSIVDIIFHLYRKELELTKELIDVGKKISSNLMNGYNYQRYVKKNWFGKGDFEDKKVREELGVEYKFKRQIWTHMERLRGRIGKRFIISDKKMNYKLSESFDLDLKDFKDNDQVIKEQWNELKGTIKELFDEYGLVNRVVVHLKKKGIKLKSSLGTSKKGSTYSNFDSINLVDFCEYNGFHVPSKDEIFKNHYLKYKDKVLSTIEESSTYGSMMKRLRSKKVPNPFGRPFLDTNQLRKYFKINKIKILSREELFQKHYQKIKSKFDRVVLKPKYLNPINKKTGKVMFIDRLKPDLRMNYSDICKELNKLRVKSPIGKEWNMNSLLQFIKLLK